MLRTGITVGAGAVLIGLLALSAIFVRSRAASAPDAPPPAPRRAAPVFHESAEGSRYSNQDLGLAVSGPDGWNATLGDRSQGRHPYEGTVVRITPPPAASKEGFQPFVSVTKRTLSDSSPRDPLTYLVREVLTPEKVVTEPPSLVTLSGRPAAKVGFRVKSSTTTLEVLQLIYLAKDDVILLTAAAPSGSFESLREQFEKVFQSLKLNS